MSHERHRECSEPPDSVSNQWRQKKPLYAGHYGQPMRGRSNAAHQDKPAYFLHQETHYGLDGTDKNEGKVWKRIVFCGDDFGMNSGIDWGILKLVKLGRLSAISCMAQGLSFVANGPSLRDINLDIGLHLNFTKAFGTVGQPNVLPLRALIARSYAGLLGKSWVDNHLLSQFDNFEKVLGRPPDYVDGHQHVHQLPGVLPRLLRILRQRYGGCRQPWLRHTAPGMQAGIPLIDSAKAHLVGSLGASEVARAARCEGWLINRRMLGVYGLQGGGRRYARLLHHWLNNARDGDLLVCHPGTSSANDMLAAQRLAELEVLARPELGDWMRLNGVRIARRLLG